MKRRSKGAFALIAAVLAFGGCEKRAQDVKVPTTAAAPDQEVAAVVDGVAISTGELEASARGQLQKLMAQVYQVKKGALEGMIADRLIEKAAKQQGVSKEEYIAQNVDAKAPAPTEEEIRAFYDQQQGRMQAPFEQMKERIADYLKGTRRNEQMQALVARLKGEADIKVMLEPPRTEVSLENAAYTNGYEGARITMIEFSDYQCPYSQRAQATVRRVLDEYRGKVLYAFFDFPLSFHQNAMKAHEAARCAGEQGKYADYNRKLFENQARLGVEDLKQYAKDLGLDAQAFDSCLDTGKSAAAVQQSIQKGSGAGVSGTPAFFVNGILISGAQPFESFQETIRAELER
jgi:protein-disulfide isomerase